MTPEKISSLLQDRIAYAIAYERTDLANGDGFKNYAIRADGTLYEHASGGGYAVDIWYLESDDADEGETKTVCDSIARDLFFDWQRMQTATAPTQYVGPILEAARAKMHNNQHLTPFELLAATIAARIIDKANAFDAYGPRETEDTDDEGRLWFQAVDPLTSEEIEIAPPGFGYSFEMWRPEATTDDEAEEQFDQERRDATDIAHSIAFGILAARRVEARRLARLNLLRARIMRRALERNRLTARQKPEGQRLAARAHAAMMRIDQLLTREYIAATKADREPIR